MSEEDPGFRVTLKDVYLQGKATAEQVGTMVGVLNNHVDNTTDKFKTIDKILADHEDRIRGGEKQRWRWVGGVGAIVALLGLATALVIAFVHP